MRVKITTIGLLQFDSTLLDNIVLPESIDRETLVANLCERAGEFPLLYPDPDFMRYMLAAWSAAELPIWEKLAETTDFEYNPLDNYDRTDSITRTSSSTASGTSTDSSTSFNTYNQRETGGRSDSSQASGSETTSVRSHGNVGVTSTMDLIAQQRDIVQYNLYETIIRSYIDRFCIELY